MKIDMDEKEIYKRILGMVDLTSLSSTDTHSKIAAMAGNTPLV